MTPVVLLKGDDISVLLNDKIIDAVISLNIKETVTYYNIYQYLSGEPAKQIPLKREYNLILKKSFSEDNPFKNIADFSLEVKYPGKTVLYEHCNLTEEESELLQNKDLVTIYKINALLKNEQEA